MGSEKDKVLQEENTPRDYVAVRVTAVHVKKGLFGIRHDKVLGFHIAIPDTREKSAELFGRIREIMKEYGVSFLQEPQKK